MAHHEIASELMLHFEARKRETIGNYYFSLTRLKSKYLINM